MNQNNRFAFNDVKDSIESFNGKTGKSVSDWLKGFGDISSVCGWNEIQKYLYARRLLRGTAKLTVESVKNVRSWEELKKLLENEFEMEIIPEGKHFRLVQESELPEILEYLERYLPESLKFHQTIKTYLNDRVWDFHFYVSKDWPEKPIILHFPGCTLTPNNNIYQSFGIFCPSSRIECVDLMRTEDVLIDWQKPLYLNFTHKDIMNRLDDFYSTFGIMERLEGDIYVCKNLNTELQLEDLPPNEAEMRPLTTDDVKGIHDLYPASEIECVEVFEILVRLLPGLGIFRKDTNELAAWMVHSYYGAMFSMQTRPDYRRKGYGIRLARTLTKLVIERGYTPFVVIRPENDASRNLYTKLGFEKAYETCRVKMTPRETNGKELDADENRLVDEGIEDMLAEKCDISNEKGSKEKVTDEGIEEDK